MPGSMRPTFSLGWVMLVMAAAVYVRDTATGPPMVQAEATGPRADGDRLNVAGTEEGIVVDIESQFGIGRAVLRPGAAGWPRQIRFRLHLQALEGFEAWADDRRFRHEAPEITDGPPVEVMLPADFVLPTTPEISIQWVDRYRH